MSGFKSVLPALCATLITTLAGLSQASAVDEVYAPREITDVRTDTLGWVAGKGMKDQATLQQIGKLWASSSDASLSNQALFEKVIQTFSLVDSETKTFVESCRLRNPSLLSPDPKPLADKKGESFYLKNIRLYYARYLTQRKMYDEALEHFNQIEPTNLIDPASYLYHKAVCEHQLLMKEEGLKTIQTLLNNTEDVPARYSTVATLMQHELKAMKEKSLSEIAHMMKDVERRLDLGRGGQRVQRQEAKVLTALDEIIEKMEQQGGS